KKNNYHVITARFGEEAFKKIDKECPDLILLDMILPDITGLMIMERLKNLPAPPPVIVMTAHSSEESILQALRHGVKDFIVKPFRNEDFLERVKRVVREINFKKEEERILKEKEILLEQLKNVQEMKNKFLDMIIHNLKNPLNSVLGFASILATRELSVKEKMEYYKIIDEQGKRMLIMLDDLLKDSFYREGKIPLEFNALNIKEMLEGSISNAELNSTEKKIKFIALLDDDLNVSGDREKLTEVIENLIDNAFKFTPNGGQININTRSEPSGVWIMVSDTGIGIPENMLDKIFLGTPLISRKGLRSERGTGLGLAFCKKIVELHGGKIKVESKENKGTIVSVFIPLKPPFMNEKEPWLWRQEEPETIG
ncbi:MAG TPA: hybrid sensor histidine kinase/response regulator, partial [Candidatus Eremiobacteraeota bacterium]|nr:hybrid sensor histidine kinase/response regulator [Candidatus Eremiobacteraeota bacterium]